MSGSGNVDFVFTLQRAVTGCLGNFTATNLEKHLFKIAVCKMP